MRVCLYRGISLTSRVIRWRTWSPYSHVSLWWDPADRDSGGGEIESWPGQGVHRNARLGAGHTPGTEIDLFAIRDLGHAQAAAAWEFAEHQLGMAYDYHGIAGFISRRDGAQARHKWFCSELVFAALSYAGIHLLRRTEAWRVDPGVLALSPLLIEDGVVFAPPDDLAAARHLEARTL